MPTSKKSGLGRGLGSLIPENFNTALLVDEAERVQQLPLDALVPRPNQPRTVFDKSALEELAGSIRRHGVVLPLVVCSLPAGNYEIIAGERRWRAAKIAGQKTVPAIVRTFKELERLEIALIENVQRVDLSPLEQAASIEQLHQQFNLAYTEIAQRLGKAETTVSNIVRLLQLPQNARLALATNKISEGHARQILALKAKPQQQDELLKQIIAHGWTVRQAERFVTSIKMGLSPHKTVSSRVAVDTDVTKQLSKRLGAKVQVRHTAKGGKIEIGFTSEDDLNDLLALLAAVQRK